MTLDNGIYIIGLRRPDTGTIMYFIREAHAIENIFNSWVCLWQFTNGATIVDGDNDARAMAFQIAVNLDIEAECENEPLYIDAFENYTLDQINLLQTKEANVHHLQ